MPLEAQPIQPAPPDPRHRASRWSVLVPPAERPVTWAAARAHLRLDTDAEQSYGETLIDAATDYAEEATDSSLVARTLLATFYDGERLLLPRGPLIEVQGIVAADNAAVTGHEVAHVGRLARLILRGGSAGYPLSVTYRAGYATAAAVPAAIRLAILLHVGTLYENRESVTERGRVPVPHSLDDFYRLHSRATGVG